MNVESNSLQIIEENGALKVVGSDQALNSATEIKILCIRDTCVLDRDSFLKLVNLEELAIANCPKLVLLPPWIREFKKLRKIYLQNVSLCTEDDNTLYLPERLEELDISSFGIRHPSNTFSEDSFNSNNNLKSITVIPVSDIKLPVSFFECASLENLYIKYIGCFKRLGGTTRSLANLVKIDIKHDAYFKHLQDNIQSLVNLKKIVVEDKSQGDGYTVILDGIANLKNLESIRITGGRYPSLPESFKELSKLKSLHLTLKSLDTFPVWAGGFENLTEFQFNVGNRIVEIPYFVGNMSTLHSLHLQHDYLTGIPDSICNLTNLTCLHLNDNSLSSLPESIGTLVNLKELLLYQNRLTSLPESITNLTNLEYLSLSFNQLTTLPESIGDLGSLGSIDLFCNQLTSLPESISKLNNIKHLNLCYNQLTSLPESIRNLSQLTLLDLRSNNIQEFPANGNIGKVELRRIFDDKVVLDNLHTRFRRISEKGVYRKLKQKRLCWNFEKLKSFKPKPVLKTNLDENGMIEALHRLIGRITVDECGVMAEYVRKLYNPERKYKGWAMFEKYVEETKNLLGSILESDTSSIDLSLIAEAIREYCPDRQIAELKQAYYMLQGGKPHSDDLEEFIATRITSEKEYLFDYAITSGRSGQNVHVLTYWKHKLRDILGFDFEFSTNIGTLSQDPFRDSNENALDAFFNVFTPRYVIRTLTDAINNNKPVMCELMEMIASDKKLTDENRHVMGLLEDDLEHDKVNEKAVEYYLIKQNIIVVDGGTVKKATCSCCMFPVQFIRELFL